MMHIVGFAWRRQTQWHHFHASITIQWRSITQKPPVTSDDVILTSGGVAEVTEGQTSIIPLGWSLVTQYDITMKEFIYHINWRIWKLSHWLSMGGVQSWLDLRSLIWKIQDKHFVEPHTLTNFWKFRINRMNGLACTRPQTSIFLTSAILN